VTSSHLARAEHLTDTEETADTLAHIAGRCQATGLDSEVTRPILVATVTLGQRPKRGLAWANDVEMVEAVEEVTDELRNQVLEIRRFRITVYTDLEIIEAKLTTTKGVEADHLRAKAADCQAALEVLADGDARLTYVMSRLIAVPDDLGDVYEAAYQTVSRGHRLPFDGRFLGATA
jgi:hypothetical protein